MQAFSLFSVLFLALIVYHKMAFNAVISRLSAIYNHREQTLFKVIADKSERGSTIVTTNLAFSEWTNLFENTTMVAALVDRLTFRSYVLDMKGDSYRLDHSKNGA